METDTGSLNGETGAGSFKWERLTFALSTERLTLVLPVEGDRHKLLKWRDTAIGSFQLQLCQNYISSWNILFEFYDSSEIVDFLVLLQFCFLFLFCLFWVFCHCIVPMGTSGRFFPEESQLRQSRPTQP